MQSPCSAVQLNRGPEGLFTQCGSKLLVVASAFYSDTDLLQSTVLSVISELLNV